MRPLAMPPSVAPRVPMYPPGAPGMGQQLFYGQGPTLIPSQVNLSEVYFFKVFVIVPKMFLRQHNFSGSELIF